MIADKPEHGSAEARGLRSAQRLTERGPQRPADGPAVGFSEMRAQSPMVGLSESGSETRAESQPENAPLEPSRICAKVPPQEVFEAIPWIVHPTGYQIR